MTFRRLSVLISFAAAAAIAWLPVAAFGQTTARSVQSFNLQKDSWEKLVGVRLKIEGRYASLGGKLLRFQNCDLSFRAIDDLPKLSGISQTIEVTGKLVKQDGKLSFEVEQVRELPSDLTTLRDRRGRIPRGKSDGWYELGAWARQRGEFY
jgi:hypothetical protein